MKSFLVLIFLISSCSPQNGQESSSSEVPRTASDFPRIIYPSDNPYNENAVALGKKLFFDGQLSSDGTVSCAKCHIPSNGFTDIDQISLGVGDAVGVRHSMTLTNVAWGRSFFWDGRASSLEEQALGPVENEHEMDESWPNVVSKLQADPDYPGLFEQAYGTDQISKELVAKAIAQYERTLISNNSKYDQYLRGETTLTESEKLGERLFFSERTECFHCHGTILFTDNQFHDNGLDAVYTDEGLGGITGIERFKGQFKSPTLRNVEYRAHFMHDGRFSTLEEVIEHYNSGVNNSPNIDPLLQNGRSLNLTPTEKQGLVDFLKTLSDPSFIQKHSQ